MVLQTRLERSIVEDRVVVISGHLSIELGQMSNELAQAEGRAQRLAQRLAEMRPPMARDAVLFQQWFPLRPDGIHANREPGFRPSTEAVVWIPPQRHLSLEQQSFYVQAKPAVDVPPSANRSWPQIHAPAGDYRGRMNVPARSSS